MSAQDLLKEIASIKDAATVKRVFGDPMEVAGKTFIPVAAVKAGFGGGFGEGKSEDDESGEAAGGGGGMCARPLGLVEITEDQTTVHHIIDVTVLAIGGMILGGLALWTIGKIAGHKRA